MKISYSYSVVIFVLALISCQPTAKNTASSDPHKVASNTKLTQAVLLTQSEPFNKDEKNKISGAYKAQKSVVIPQDLTPQNKWIMFEGPVLENDLIAYRFYADSRHRFDIYGKRVADLVMDTVSWDYHDIMDWGSDILKVGNSLGIGSPAIHYKDSLYTLSTCTKKTIEVVDNGTDKSRIRTTFKDLEIEDHTFDLIQDWSITAGQPWCEIHLQVFGGHLPPDMYFATGIVKHLPDIKIIESQDFLCAMNWGKQTFHDEDMGMALIANKDYQPEQIENDLTHTFVFRNANSEVKYRFLAVWERDLNRVKDAMAFEGLVMGVE